MKKFLCIILAAALVLGGLFSFASAENGNRDAGTPAAAEDKEYTGKARTSFCLRSKPDENAKRGAEIKKGKAFTMLENTNAEWCRIRCGRYEGYAKKSWLNFDEEPPAPDMPAQGKGKTPLPGQDTDGKVYTGKTKSDFSLREKPDATSKRGRSVTMGKSFTMLENTNDTWCRIRVGKWEGYAKKEWLRFDEEPPRTGDLGMSTETTGAQYYCKAFKPTAVTKEQSEKSKKVGSLKRYQQIYCLEYGEEWSKIQTVDGRCTGYVKTSMLFHFQSLNSFLYPVPGYAQWKMTGYVIMKNAVKVNDSYKYYGGNDLCEGDMVMAQKTGDGTVRLQIRHDFCDLDPKDYEYHDFVDWRSAREGDCIGGFTQYFGKHQGGAYYGHRQHNIRTAMNRMNGTVIRKNEEYSFLENVQPGGSLDGYAYAGITGGEGAAIGGGICHTSTLMYEAALGLPFLITEREPHTPFGNSYAPVEFDATVGAYSDMRFINTLPYDVQVEASYCMQSGIINVRFICMETIAPEILNGWQRTAGESGGSAPDTSAAPDDPAEEEIEEEEILDPDGEE